MKHDERELDALLDRAVTSIRDQEPSPETVAEAGRRVLERLRAEGADAASSRLASCEDFQTLIPDYLAGTLPAARRLLLDDHTRSCIPCRRALTAARSGRGVTAYQAPETARRWSAHPAFRWAAAAVLVVGMGLGSYLAIDHLVLRPGTVMASVESVDGVLLGVAEQGNRTLGAEEQILYAQPIRTAKGSRAVVRLEDGSRVEMNERSEISLVERRGGTSIRVARGSVIVQAAPQHDGHLFAATDDCLVSVTGTVFSVTAGTKGSRVSVIEGEVRVDDGRDRHVLHPGDQVSTSDRLSAVPLSEEIAWSEDVDRYLALLQELSGVRRELLAAVRVPDLRYDTDLLDLAPAGSVLYAGLPNVTASLSEGYGNVLARIQESEILSQWWSERVDPEAEAEIRNAIDRLHDFGQFLGDEVALAASPGDGEGAESFVLYSRVDRPGALRAFLEGEIAGWNTDGEQHVFLVDDPSAAGSGDALWIWVDDDGLMAASNRGDALVQIAAIWRGAANPFVGSEFHAVLADSYGRGAGWLLAVDLGTVIAEEMEEDEDRGTLERSGLADARHLLIERKPDGAGSLTEAVVTFGDERRGIASWLAEPAPMGSLEYVSSEARFAAASVFKDPAAMLVDVIAMVGADDPELWQSIADFEAETGVSIYDDIAAPLGGEMTIALDGPLVPQPAWKVIVEVYDPVRLQATIGRLVDRINVELAEQGVEISLSEETARGRTFYTLSSTRSPQDLCYTFDDSYLVGAPSRALVEQALSIRASGYGLAESPDFLDRLPRGPNADFSALVFNDLGELMGQAAALFGGIAGQLTPEQQQSLQAVIDAGEPSLFCAYGEADRIVLASTGEGGWLDMPLGALLGAGTGVGIEQLLEEAGHSVN